MTSFSRDLLELHFDIEGRRVIVFNAHFKAKTNDDPDRRYAEGAGTREVIMERIAEFPNALILLGGDLNDTPGSAPISALEGNGGLSRVAAELGAEAATYVWQDRPQIIDHIYVAETPGGEYIPGSSRVVRTSDRGLAGSDHAGVRASFLVTGPREFQNP
jgi:endonuclease/exonuclease/phosphatase family metal-dependent hydrolase